MHYVLLGNDLTAWSIALGIGLSVCFFLYFAKGLVVRRIRNFKRMQTRRIVFGIGVTCETSKQQLLAIPDILRETVQAQPDVDVDRAHKAAVVAE